MDTTYLLVSMSKQEDRVYKCPHFPSGVFIFVCTVFEQIAEVKKRLLEKVWWL